MPRIPQGVIDGLAGYTILALDGPTLPQDDYYGSIWGVGLIDYGGNFEAETSWMANLATNSDLSTFPGDWVSFGFTTPAQQFPEIEIWEGPTDTWIRGFAANGPNP